ncbi:hypothetical protein [Polymorphospora rubra]|uniref:Uncharacterized protein n=1 Tax=Polymorphospora rubra TaxID=338584 RepID=A0A810MSI0_9ACTN|nr:hypothetical protein [Polymorphospora rubra]BCJ64147.1 hypothetical protein Prubr_11680 [Polymorphospora rubra]
MAYDEGDWRIPTLTVTPADGTTQAALVVEAPDGTRTALTPTGGSGSWEGPAYELTSPGEWIEDWTVTGTGAGRQRTSVLVAPVSGPVGARVYATTADLARWLHAAPPAGARRALQAASRRVDEMLLTALYPTDATGLPTTPAHIAALRDATCAQAEYARASGDATSVGATTKPSSFTLGRLSVQQAGTSSSSGRPGRRGRGPFSRRPG